MNRRRKAIGLLCAAALAPAIRADAAVLVHESISVAATGGIQGNGTSASDMVFSQFQTDGDGWGWAGGAGGVNGAGTSNAANEALNFVIGPTITSLNSTYGAGNWAIANPTLTFNSSNATQGNHRFATGAGTFNIFWVANDAWNQSAGTSTNLAGNPPYVTTQTALNTWAGNSSLLGSESFSTTGYTGFTGLSYSLASDPSFESDITSATASSNPDVSLYLMGTSPSLGLIIFTGGQNQPVPTLSFDVVSVPEPSMLCAGGIFLVPLLKRRSRE